MKLPITFKMVCSILVKECWENLHVERILEIEASYDDDIFKGLG